jgi:hypothetical protein
MPQPRDRLQRRTFASRVFYIFPLPQYGTHTSLTGHECARLSSHRTLLRHLFAQRFRWPTSSMRKNRIIGTDTLFRGTQAAPEFLEYAKLRRTVRIARRYLTVP